MSKDNKERGILTTQRLEAFSDSVIAIVITLLFLELRVPEIAGHDNWRELFYALVEYKPKYLSIFISFTFVAIFWVSHHQFFHTLKKTTRGLLWLNLVFLFLVCFVPFPAATVGEYPQNKSAVIFFGLTVLLTSCVLVTLRWYAWIRHREISSVKEINDAYKSLRRSSLTILLYVIGIIVSFFYPMAAIGIYLVTPVALLFPVNVNVENEDDSESKEEDEESVEL